MDFIDKFKSALPKEINFDDLYDLAPADLWKSDPKKAGVIALERAEIFDCDAYLKNYPDVRDASADATEHFVTHGIEEQREFLCKSKQFNNEKYMPIISVIIYLQNSQDTLPRCIDSVIIQGKDIGYENLQIILLDNSSNNKYDSIINFYTSFFSSIITVIKFRKNTGKSIAYNIGIERAAGKYITFIDSDDMFLNGFLKESIYIAFKSKSDIVSFNVVYDDYKTKIKSKLKDIEFSGKHAFLNLLNKKMLNLNGFGCIYRLSFIKDNNISYQENVINFNVVFNLSAFYLSNTTISSSKIG